MAPVASTSKAIAPPAQPTPSYILRGHTAQISIIFFSRDGRTLFSGDVDGHVAVWDLKVFRPRLFWKAHEGGLLAVEEWDEGILSQGRDNRIHYFALPPRPSSISRSSASAIPSPKDPSSLLPSWSMDVNAMAYCKMSVLSLGDPRTRNEGIVAVPSLTKDEEIDIFHLPSQSRVHRAIGASLFPIGSKTGTLMAVTLFLSPSPTSELCILAGYEDGRVALFRFTGTKAAAFEPPRPGTKQDESEGWELVWDEKGHREALMSLALAPDKKSAWSVAADHFVCRYDLRERMEQPDQKTPVTPSARMIVLPTTAPGRSTIAIRDDGKLIGVAGWDGEARLYSAKTGAPLAVLSYHRMSLHALAFAPTIPRQGAIFEEVSDEEDSEDEDGTGRLRAWMATGGKDDRISLWEVYPPP